MKKLIYIIPALGLLAVSCTKDYSCTCTSTTTSAGEVQTFVDKYEISEASSKQAKLACNEATIIETGTNWLDETYTTETTCELK
jgi:hypothetical protein